NFFFTVDFQWEGTHASAPFSEVSGLKISTPRDWEKVDNPSTQLPVPEDLVLKRPVEPSGDPVSDWVNRCLRLYEGGRVERCQLVIKLENAQHEIAAAWRCSNAYPVNWETSPPDENSRLATETFTLMYGSLTRTQ
ncbi:MAG: phage tail protein, partial [Prevotellaceae bacterium]|nr:phage tail protein [Prevotellaceae bacterium]